MVRTTPGLLLAVGLAAGGTGAHLVNTFDASTGVAVSAAVIGALGIGIALATAPITTIAVTSLPPDSPPSLAPPAAPCTRSAAHSALRTSVFLSTLPGHLAASDLGTPDRRHELSMVSDAGIQAGAFLRLSTGPATAEAQAVYGASFTHALHTCTLGGIGMLGAAAVALVAIAVCQTAHNAAAGFWPFRLSH